MAVWIDLTDFLNWKGNLTGIQRIQFNISKKFIESGQTVRFFVYHEKQHDFVEVDFDPECLVTAGTITASMDVDDVTGLSGLFDKVSSRLSSSRIVKKIGEIVRAKRTPPTDTNVVQCPFAQHDTVLVMGGIWVGSFIDDLAKCKDRCSFTFVHFAFDMIPTVCPGYVVEWLPDAFRMYKKKVYSIAEGVIAISESTAQDARNFIDEYGITPVPRIQVVRIGEGIHVSEPGDDSLSSMTGHDFILSVSTVEGRKNHAALFYALKEARRRGVQLPKIVVVGRNGWLTDDIRYMMTHDLEAKDGIVLLDSVDDNQLNWLYQNCLFTVFPSFYEGWGMPVAESLSYGKLCLSSDTSSMPEIAGDLIDYFSPYDTGALLDCIVDNLSAEVRVPKEDRIREEYHQTSWGDMFEKIDTFLKSVKAGE